MKTIFADKNNFNKKPKYYVNLMQSFGIDITEQSMQNTINNNCFYCFVLIDKDIPITWCRVAKPYYRKTIYVIRQIETKQEYKRKGSGTFCYEAVKQYLEKLKNAKVLVAFVDKENKESNNFHKKQGFIKSNKVSKYLNTLYGWDSSIMYEHILVTK